MSNILGLNKNMNVKIECIVCGISVQCPPSRIGRKKYCSKKCQYKAMQDHTPWNKGLAGQYHQLESEKYGEAGKRRWANKSPEERKIIGDKISKAKIGFKYTDESKLKMRMSQLGKKHTEEHIAKTMKAMRKYFASKQPTSIETKLYEELKNRGLLFETQKQMGGRFIVDAYIPSLNLIVEADGDYWHNLEKVKDRDIRKDKFLKEQGFNILRLTETEINNGSFRERMNN